MNVSSGSGFGSVVKYSNQLAQVQNPLTSQAQRSVMDNGAIKKSVDVEQMQAEVGSASRANAFRGVGQKVSTTA